MTGIDWCSGLVRPGPKITNIESDAKIIHSGVPISILNYKIFSVFRWGRGPFRSSVPLLRSSNSKWSCNIWQFEYLGMFGDPIAIFFSDQTPSPFRSWFKESPQASSFLWLWSPPKKCLFQVVVVTFLHCVQLQHINLMKLFLVIAALFLLHSISKLTQNENHKSTCCVIIKLSKKPKSLFFLLTSAERTFTYVCLSACVKNNNTLECQQCLGDFFKPEIYKGGSNVLTPKYGHVVIFFVAG